MGIRHHQEFAAGEQHLLCPDDEILPQGDGVGLSLMERGVHDHPVYLQAGEGS